MQLQLRCVQCTYTLKKEKTMTKVNYYISKTKLEKIQNLVNDLGWDYDRMSSSGQETYDELCKVLGLEMDYDFEELVSMMNSRRKK